MAEIDQTGKAGDAPPNRQTMRWKRLWRAARVPMQVIAGQLVAWALRKLLD